MKKLWFILLLAGCTGGAPEAGCNLAQFDAFIGQDPTALTAQQSGQFVVIRSSEAWTGTRTGRQTIVFLDADGRIQSFGCG